MDNNENENYENMSGIEEAELNINNVLSDEEIAKLKNDEAQKIYEKIDSENEKEDINIREKNIKNETLNEKKSNNIYIILAILLLLLLLGIFVIPKLIK